MKVISVIVEELFKLLLLFLKGLFHLFVAKKKTGYSSSLLSAGKVLSSFNRGWRLTGLRSISEKRSFENFLLIGSTGSGKSSIPILSSLFSMLKTRGSALINDPSGEIRLKTSGFMQIVAKAKVMVINFKDHMQSVGYNPLAHVSTIGQIQQISQTLIKASLKKSSEPFWELSAIALLTMIIRFLKVQAQQFHTLGNCLHLVNILSSDPESLDNSFARLSDEPLFQEYCTFTAYDSKVKMSIIATVKAALAFVSDPSIQHVTNRNDLDFERLRNERVIVYVNNKVSDAQLYSPIVSVLYTQFFEYVMSELPDQKVDQPIWGFIDECSSLTLSNLQIALANVRKHSCGLLIGYQNFNQMKAAYGVDSAKAIRANCYSEVYLSGMSHEQSVELSDIIGKHDVKDEEGRIRTLPLKTPQELRTLKKKAVVLLGNEKPVITKVRPYFRSWKLRKWSELEPVIIELSEEELQERETVLLPLHIQEDVEYSGLEL